jgi:hypothetical protein
MLQERVNGDYLGKDNKGEVLAGREKDQGNCRFLPGKELGHQNAADALSGLEFRDIERSRGLSSDKSTQRP